jgi:FMN-dependent oxidoreductase (nitrilotriacetate monooxygenase family)
VKAIDHKGPHFPVTGPLNMPRAPQGRPVFVQAGSSDTGKKFAARHAEAVFTAHLEKATARAFYTDLKQLVAAEGRNPRDVVILPGFSPTIASTEAEAERYAAELNELSDPEVGRARLSQRFGGHDFSPLALDQPLSVDDFPDPSKNEASRSRTEAVVALVARERPTLRQLLAKLAGARGHFTAAGSPEMIADTMQDWIETGAADGFNLMPPVLPHQLDLFISEVVPLLRKRGLFRDAYDGETLRSHFGLSRPVGWI